MFRQLFKTGLRFRGSFKGIDKGPFKGIHKGFGVYGLVVEGLRFRV